MDAVEAVRAASRAVTPVVPEPEPAVVAEAPPDYDASSFDRAAATERLIAAVEARGFVYEPFEVAAYVTALRTKPSVLLAGPTGVGKSRLPALVAEATGGRSHLVPVRPDWTDPAETLGYTDLAGRFRPGALLRVAREASDDAGRHHTLVLDELNLGRPEHFLAEVLSRMEARERGPNGFESPPLLTERLGPADAAWQGVRLPANLGIVGTVNVDESAHAFSAKVLDRAFVLTLAATDLDSWTTAADTADATAEAWPSEAWGPRALRLGGLGGLSGTEQAEVERAVGAVTDVARILGPAGLGPGYRTRDEVALFALHALGTPGAFRTRVGQPVDPLDVALAAKILPRLDGAPSREALGALLEWASGQSARDAVETWSASGRERAFAGARFPLVASRLAALVDGADVFYP